MTRCHFNQQDWIRYIWNFFVFVFVFGNFSSVFCLLVTITFTLFWCVEFRFHRIHNIKGQHTVPMLPTSYAHRTQFKWFNRFDILSQCPFKCVFIHLSYSIANESCILRDSTYKQQMNECINEVHLLLFFFFAVSSLPMPCLLMFTFQFGAFLMFFFVDLVRFLPRVSCSCVRLNS